jgi:TetR/AcrR family transcriptional regulator, transcriptional repressor of bet genes
MKNIPRASLKYVAFGEIYLRYSEPKAKRRAFSLFEAAIKCFDNKGLENVTLKTIAREAGVTAPLLRHYFSGLAEIRELTLKYIGVISQKIVIDAIHSTNDPVEMYKRYVQAHLYWSLNFKRHLRVWISFLAKTAKRKTDRAFNTLAISAGTHRIVELISAGKLAGSFTHSDNQVTAKLIQTLILGWVIALATEELENPELYSKSVVDHCMKLVGAST